MPQASAELQDEMIRRFGDMDVTGPEDYLKERGWTLTRKWTWTKPGVTIGSTPRDEFDCILFLIHEWDYGGIET